MVHLVRFRLERGDRDLIKSRVSDYLRMRKEKQPLEYPSAGSVFKNPPNDYAGRLIEEAGLKGRRIGGALISPRHANFIVNTGGASAEDVVMLISFIKQQIRSKLHIQLNEEILYLGF